MRTTIEMKSNHRAELLEIAARRNEKGFSNLIAEAIDLYLDSLAERERRATLALRLKGCLSAPEAHDLTAAVDRLRAQSTWP